VAWPLTTAEPRIPAWEPATVEALLDDIDDFVDHKAHRAAVGEHQDRLGAGALDVATLYLHQRHQLLAAVLYHVTTVTELDLVGGDLFQTTDEAERHRLGLASPARNTSSEVLGSPKLAGWLAFSSAI
jgi:hypothetical protein